MLIRITAGAFGHQNEKGRVQLIRTGEVVQVDDNIGARLIAEKKAEQVELIDPPEELKKELQGNEYTSPEYSVNMTRDKLEEIAQKFYNIDAEDLAAAKSKAEIVAMIDEAKNDVEGAPDLNAADAIS